MELLGYHMTHYPALLLAAYTVHAGSLTVLVDTSDANACTAGSAADLSNFCHLIL